MTRLNKKALIWFDQLGGWAIAIAVLIIMVIGYMIMKNKGVGAIEFIKDMLRFGK
tara:strand:+ start:27 stop:191 length:165 start_codon:yes stop_codon:yes gene_type:complete